MFLVFDDVSLELTYSERDLGRLLTLRELRTRLIRKLRMWASQLMIFLTHVCSTSLFSSLRKGPAKVGPFFARRTCDSTVVRWRKSLISYVNKQQASDNCLMLGSLDIETLEPTEKFVEVGRNFVDANRDLFLRVGRTSLLAR